MAKKRSYDITRIQTRYEDTLEQQEERERDLTAEEPAAEPIVPPSPSLESPTKWEEEYTDPDYEEYKRISLFADYDTWERIQAMCWSENQPVNKVIVDLLREWSIDISQDTLDAYNEVRKQKHLAEWREQRAIIQYWWETSDAREKMHVQTYKLNRNSLTIIEESGMIHNYCIHRGWVVDDDGNKLARAKSLYAQMRRMNLISFDSSVNK